MMIKIIGKINIIYNEEHNLLWLNSLFQWVFFNGVKVIIKLNIGLRSDCVPRVYKNDGVPLLLDCRVAEVVQVEPAKQKDRSLLAQVNLS